MYARFTAAAVSVSLLMPGVLHAGTNLLTDGPEFRANGFTLNAQTGARGRAVSRSADGSFVVVWSGNGAADLAGIFGRRFDGFGTVQGGDFAINTYTTSTQRDPAVGSADDGSFVVVWDSFGQDGSDRGIFGRRYDAGGAAAATEFQINTYTTGAQFSPALAVAGDGSFVALWVSLHDGSGRGVFGQRFDAAGNVAGTEFQVNTYTTGNQQRPMVDCAADGSFVVSWDSAQDGDLDGVFGQRFNPTAAPIGTEFQVNAFTSGQQRLSDIAVGDGGDFVLSWGSIQDGDGYGVFGQRFDAAATKVGGEFQINSYTTGDQIRPVLDINSDGSFLVAWRSAAQDGDGEGIFAQCYDPSGAASGAEFQVNTYTTGNQDGGNTVAGDGAGNYTIVWVSSGQDGSLDGVFGQVFCNDADADSVCDRDDRCPGFDDAVDSDGDGLPDGCDACPNDPLNDVDGDGICGDVDNCPNVGNPSQIDGDGDGNGDACDLCPGFDDNVDSDADGAPDGCDLCPGFDDSLDADGDGFPDGCDVCPGFDDSLDIDGDGVPDGCDTCSTLDPAQILQGKPKLILKKINTDTVPSNDGLIVKGEFVLPVGSDFSVIQPLGSAVRVELMAMDGTVKLSETLVTTSFAGKGTAGWKQNGSGSKWIFLDKSATPANGLVKMMIQDRSTKVARQVKILVKGKAGTYPVVAGEEPVIATVVVGSGAAGQCTVTDFVAGECAFTGNGKNLKCRR